jgi:MSHA biogenesis protein MshO
MAPDRRFFSVRPRAQRGFTLIEMIISMVLLGLLMVVVTMVLRLPINAYYDILRRSLLSDQADAAARRVTQEVRGALPNSIRLAQADTANGYGSCVEFLPAIGGGSYRSEKDASGSGDVLSFSSNDTSFDVLAANNLPDFSSPSNTYHVVIYNLGIPGADAYSTDPAEGINHAQITTSGSTASNIKMAATRFPFESPYKRFMVIPDNTVIFSCSGGKLYRTTRTLAAASAAALSSCPATGQLLADKVGVCNFAYSTGVTSYSGLLSVRLGITDMGETVTLYRDINVDNTP